MKSILKIFVLFLFLTGSGALATDLSDYEEFAARAQQAAIDRDWEFFTLYTDADRLWEKVTVDFPDPKGDAGKFAQGMESTIRKKCFGGTLAEGVGLYDDYTLLRVRSRDGLPHMLFRLNGDDGVNYHEFLLGRDEGGDVVIEDVFIYLLGQYLSEMFRGTYNEGISAFDSWLDMFTGERAELTGGITKMKEAQALMAQGAFAEAYEKVVDLADNDIYARLAGLTAISCAAQIDEDTYREAMDRFGKQFPDDPAWLLVSLDYYYYQGRLDDSIMAIRKVDRMVGGDPILTLMEANLRVEMGEIEEALVIILKVKEDHPELEEASWSLVTLAIVAGDHQMVADELDYLADRYGYYYTAEDMAEESLYDDFMASETGKAWLAKHLAGE